MLKKIISSILIVLLIMQILPMSVFAEEELTLDNETEECYIPEENIIEPKIISEITDKRDENTKHFLMSDGTFIAAQYNMPVHYQNEEKQWVEYDNSLKKTIANEEQIALFGDVELYQTSNLINNIVFAKKSNSNTLVSYENTEYPISLNYKSAKKSKIKITDNEIYLEGNEKFTALTNITQEILYKDIFTDVDLQYIVSPEEIKENIILKNKDAKNIFTVNYNIGELNAEVIDSQTINLVAGEDLIYTIAAPYMYDANGAISTDVTFTVNKNKNGKLTIEITADKNWLQNEDRVFPVTIDPYIFEANKDISNDESALEFNGSSLPSGSLIVGRNYTYGKCRSFLKHDLPTLSAGDMVIDAKLNLYQFSGSSGYSADDGNASQINISKVIEFWDDNSIKNSSELSNLPAANYDCILDYINTSSSTSGKWVTFNVGSTVKSWYNGDANNGFVLWSSGENDSMRRATVFASANYAVGTTIAKPTLTIIYLNNKGLEDRWTYHSQSLGESGTSYINDCTGNLVFVSPVAHTVGNNAPISVNLVYNGYLVNSSGTGIGKCGPGWRFDFQQQITPIASGTALYTSGFRYIYTDADGTDHYFKAKGSSTSQFEDEEGLGFTLTVGSDGDSKYTLEFKSGNKNIYNTNGAIVKICDTDNNYYKFTYSNNKVSYITDGANRKISFTYTSAGYFSTITDAANRVTTISYASPAKISKITYPDGTSTKFEYDSDSRLFKCIGIDGTALKYEYPTSSYNTVKNRVTKVSQLATDETVGDYLNINYSYNNYTVFTDKEERSETYLFDSCGRTICVSDASGGISSYSYSTGDSTSDSTSMNNKLTAASAKTKYVNNLLKNHSFENGNNNWSLDGSGGTCNAVSGNAYLGNNALKISKTSTSNLKRYQRININNTTFKVDETYTFSAYIKTTTATPNASIYVNCFDNSSGSNVSLAVYSSPVVNEKLDEYKRLYFYFTIPQGTDFVNFVLSSKGTGDTYFDCIQAEEGKVVNNYNLLENSDFSSADKWVGSSKIQSTEGVKNGRCVINGITDGKKNVYQEIIINKPASDCAFSFSATAEGNSVPLTKTERYFSLNAVLYFDDGTEQYFNQMFNPDITSEQYATMVIKASPENSSKTITKMRARLAYYYNANAVYFDNASLNIDTTGTTYTYDDNGNIESAVDNAKNNQSYTFNNANELIKANYQDNTKYEYTYDTTYKHRLLSAKSVNSNINISYAYNNKGFVTSTTVTGGNKTIVTSNTYSGTNSNFLASETDSLGNKTSYTYNTNQGTVSSVTTGLDANDSTVTGTKTKFTYNNNNDYLTSVTVEGTDSSVSYQYGSTNRALNSITTNTCVYNFAYDKFMNVSSVSVGTQKLTTNSYAANTGNLTKSTYGNSDSIVYEYDNLDRVIQKSYNDSNGNQVYRYNWAYDASNRMSRYFESTSGMIYNYTYDLSDRLIEMYRKDGAYIRTDYDTKNLSTGIEYSFGGVNETFDYTYIESKDNAPYSATFTDGSESRITYDSIGRKLKDLLYKNGTSFFNTTYEYLSNATDSSKTSGLVSGLYYNLSNIPDLEYEYDNHGNIVRIIKGDIEYDEYTYDALNRLVRADSESEGLTYTYTYDASGNIKTKKIYASAFAGDTISNDDLIDTITYSYDSTWGDKLVSYDGKTITYDEIGNPLSYDGQTFTWLGRRLSTHKNGPITTSYTYNSDGIRNSKTVGGITTEYFLNGSTILAQKTGATTIPFYYDANGTRIAFKYNGTMYYYVYNLQGDVTHIIDSTGAIKGTYQYDAWGKLVNSNSLTSIAQINPFRYRGYYYDTESGLYYLNSRYYNAEWGRFINADSQLNDKDGVLGYNLFLYCNDNPIIYSDPSGHSIVLTCIIIGAAIGAVAGGCAGAYISKKQTGKVNGWAVAASAVGGGVVGGLVGWGIGAAVTAIGAAATGGAATAAAPVVQQVAEKASTALQTYYPPNDGFSGAVQKITLEAGTLIQRTGDLVGRYIAPAGTPTQMLALPYDKIGQPTTILQVQQSVDVLAGRVAPWFGQIGCGIQYQLDTPLDQLISEGIITIFGG